MTFLRRRSGATRTLGCPDIVATAADGYESPLVIDSSSGGIFFGADWLTPTLLNSWVNFGSGLQIAQYRKVGDMVQLRGTIKSGASTVFVLPAGFRPPAQVQFAVPSNNLFGLLSIDSLGNVVPAVGSATSFGLDGASFSLTP